MSLLRGMPAGWRVVRMTTVPERVTVVDPAGVQWTWHPLGGRGEWWEAVSGRKETLQLSIAPWAVDRAALAAATTSAECLRLGSTLHGRAYDLWQAEQQAEKAAAEQAAIEAAAAGVPIVIKGTHDSWEVSDPDAFAGASPGYGTYGGSGYSVTVGNWTKHFDRRADLPAWTASNEAAQTELLQRKRAARNEKWVQQVKSAISGLRCAKGHEFRVYMFDDNRLIIATATGATAAILHDDGQIKRGPRCTDATWAILAAALT